ncbi:unnamed protein product [Calypogeia fissa]
MESGKESPLAGAFESLYRKSESIQYAVVDGFVGDNCRGNPAAVVVLSEWKDDQWMQDVAAEFNHSATAYLVKKEKKPGKEDPNEDRNEELVDNNAPTKEPQDVIHEYDLRWFTPRFEVNLCGLGTFASAHLLYHTGAVSKQDTIFFHTKGGLLSTRCIVPKVGDAQTDSSEETKKPKVELIEMNFPWITTTPASDADIKTLSGTLRSATTVSLGKASTYLIVELETREDMDKLQPNMQELLKCDSDGLLAIAPAEESSGFDFVSRVFLPKMGMNEDPVTGSAHCILGPYWASKTDKYDLLAHQISQRGGILVLSMDKKMGRVSIKGQANISMAGVLVN